MPNLLFFPVDSNLLPDSCLFIIILFRCQQILSKHKMLPACRNADIKEFCSKHQSFTQNSLILRDLPFACLNLYEGITYKVSGIRPKTGTIHHGLGAIPPWESSRSSLQPLACNMKIDFDKNKDRVKMVSKPSRRGA